MKVVFIVGSITDSHIVIRIETFLCKGFDIDVYGYTRDVNFTNKIEGVKVNVIGNLENAKYANRIIKGWKAITNIVEAYPRETLYYIWGLDIAMVHLIHRTKYVYEESDIRYAEFRFPLCSIFKYIDRCVIRHSIASFLTSAGFIDYIGGGNSVRKKIFLFPNKLACSFKDFERRKTELNTKLRFSYAGLYRYPNTVLKLAEVIGKSFPQYEFHFYGKGNDAIMALVNELVNKYSNVFEHGPFKNPSDLPYIYDNIDIVACNYDIEGENEKMAEPNKLYEAIFFNKPIIVSDNTFLARKVRKLNIGLVIKGKGEKEIYDFVKSIDYADLKFIQKNEANIPKEELIEDYSQMLNLIDRYNENLASK